MTGPTLEVYSLWFCPFAQRAWIAANELQVPYVLREVDPYDKSDSNPLKKVNPRCLVPALSYGEGRNVYESMICVEFMDDEFGGKFGDKRHLYPKDTWERAQARIWIDAIGKGMVTHFYKVLQFQPSDPDWAGHRDKYLESLQELDRAMQFFQELRRTQTGSHTAFFMGGDFGAVDIALAPWAVRDYVLKHYRHFEVPQTAEYARYNAWLEAVRARESVKTTLADEQKLIESYVRYADNTVKSLVADATRAGKPLP